MTEEHKEPDAESRPQSENATSKEPPVRVCRNCSAQSRTFDDTCPYCGASFIRSRRLRAKRRLKGLSKRQKIVIGGVILGLVVGGIATGAIAKVNHDNLVAQQHREEQEKRQLAHEERVEEEQLAEEELEEEEELKRAEMKYARSAVNELEAAITDEANGEAEEGFSEYVSDTSCEAESGKLEPSRAAQKFSCLAITSEEDGLQEGYPYTATINYINGSYRWSFGRP